MRHEDKKPPAPRLLRPEDVHKAARRTPAKNHRRSRPQITPPPLEEHKSHLKDVAKKSAGISRNQERQKKRSTSTRVKNVNSAPKNERPQQYRYVPPQEGIGDSRKPVTKGNSYSEVIVHPNNAMQQPIKNGDPRSKTSTMSPGDLVKTIRHSKKQIKVKKKKAPVSSAVMSVITIGLFSSLSLLGAYGYSVYKDNTVKKAEDTAYARGAESASGDKTVDSVMRLDEKEVNDLILNSPSANFPHAPVLTNQKLVGYSIPGGEEGRGRANITFCYAASDVEGKRTGRAYFVTDDGKAQKPYWRVDAVNLTQEPCS